MSETLFVQFFIKVKQKMGFYNGFSDVWNLCKNIGDFFWVDVAKDTDLPIKKGKVFVSISYKEHFKQLFSWVINNPDIHFVVGGPAIKELPVNIQTNKNLFFTTKSVEEYFGIQNFSYDWWLDIPEFAFNEEEISFSYTLDEECTWKKCTFCDYYKTGTRKRPLENIHFNFDKLNFNNKQYIYLGSPGLTKPYIEIIPKLPIGNKLRYGIMIRSERVVREAIDNTFRNIKGNNPFSINGSFIGLGVEFPSNKILKFIKKGLTIEDFERTIELLHKYNCGIRLNIIVGWPNLDENDILCLENFMKNIPKTTSISIFKLFCFIGTPLYEEYKNIKDREEGERPLYRGYFPTLTNYQKHLNMKALEIVKKYNDNIVDLTGGI